MQTSKKKEVVEKFRKSDKDCGSAQVQIALLTAEIAHIDGHLKTHKKDHHSRRGLLVMVGKRKRMQTYLKRKDPASYAKLAETLGIK